MDLRERKRGLRSTSWDDGHEKPVKSCLALHEMDLKPFSRNCGQVPPKREDTPFPTALYKSGLCRETFAKRHFDVQVSPFRRDFSKIS